MQSERTRIHLRVQKLLIKNQQEMAEAAIGAEASVTQSREDLNKQDYVIPIDSLRPLNFGEVSIGAKTKSSSQSKVLAPTNNIGAPD